MRSQLNFLKMGQPRPLFHLFLSFQTHTTIVSNKQMWKNSSQYMVPGLEHMTFWTRVSSHNN